MSLRKNRKWLKRTQQECQLKGRIEILRASLTCRSINFKILAEVTNYHRRAIKKIYLKNVFGKKIQGEKSDDGTINLEHKK